MKLHSPTIREIMELRGATPGLFGAVEGAAPAGTVHRGDAIEAVPGTGVTIDGQSLDEIWNAIRIRNAAFNRTASAFIALLTFPTALANEKVGVPSNPEFQEATEFGRPSKVRVKKVGRGFPLVHYDLGYGYTQEFIDDASSTQISAIQSEVETAYERLRVVKVLEAIFGDTNYTDADNIAVKRLYNADGEVPPRWQRWIHTGTHDHYLTSAGASLVTTDLDDAEEELVHHGFSEETGTRLILFAHRDEVAVIRGFDPWVPAETGDRPIIICGPIVGPTGVGLGGFAAQGYHGKWTVVENNELPSGYLLGLATGGQFNARNVAGFRSHRNTSARGLRLIEGPNGRYPLIDAVYDTYMGAGVGQRGAAVVQQVTAGSYTVPTFF